MVHDHHRRSIRLPDYDYASDGAYFVTICVQDHQCVLGDIVAGEMRLNTLGCIVDDIWATLPVRYPHITLDEYVIMPNHMHGIIIINKPPDDPQTTDPVSHVGAIHELPLPDSLPRTDTNDPKLRRIMLLPLAIGYFKMNATKRINQTRRTPGARFWQRNYWEHIIRSEIALARIRTYIAQNPDRWAEDRYNPARLTT